jgi:hypothetical protein
MVEKPVPMTRQLHNWAIAVPDIEIDAILEWLGDNDCLNGRGKDFAHLFWSYVYEQAEDTQGQEKKIPYCFGSYQGVGDQSCWECPYNSKARCESLAKRREEAMK